ncbi:MAG: diguanylate cyclase [Janthinobacterium lividum]
MPFSSFHNQVASYDAARLEALHSLQILDTAPEKSFDEAVRLASAICGTPIAVVNLLDEDRQWFKARVGISATEMPRTGSFCNYLIGETEPMVISDAAIDARFCDNPFVTGDPNVRFYAGMPLNTTEGQTLGTLCVIDTVPHHLTADQTEALAALGRQVTAQIELQAKVRLLRETLKEKERVEGELRRQTLLFGAFMDHSPTMGFMKDREGRFLYYNRVFCERFAVSPTEWIGKSVFDLFPMEFASAYHELDMAVLDSGVAQILEETSPGPEGRTYYWRTHKFLIADGENPPILGGLSLDISSDQEASARLRNSHAQLEVTNQQLTELSVTDGLTGLRNRRAFDDRLATEMNAGTALSLLLLDIDYFKSLNDNYGHPAGDEVLRALAALLAAKSRGADCVARFGGEEFAILLIGTGEQGALVIAERLRIAVESFAWIQRPVTVSAGVATRSSSLEGATKLLAAADEALYRAKHLGRNRVEVAR